jgi:fructokinase
MGMADRYRIGVDLGGTKIEAAMLGPDSRPAWRRRIASPAGDYDGIVDAIVGLVEAAERETGRSAPVGVGIPGAIDPATGLVKNANTTGLIGRPFGRDLEARLRRPVRLANDANCLIASEATDGAAAGARVAFGIILGTGVGGGLAIEGRAHQGVNAIAGEWGHNPLPWPEDRERPGPACYCGKRGCIETFLSGPALSADHQASTGIRLDGAAIVAAAQDGEPSAEATMRRYEDRLARATATLINLLDPEIIVLGGGLSQIERLYRNVPALWPAYVFSPSVVTPLVAPRHGDASGVRGAAFLWE